MRARRRLRRSHLSTSAGPASTPGATAAAAWHVAFFVLWLAAGIWIAFACAAIEVELRQVPAFEGAAGFAMLGVALRNLVLTQALGVTIYICLFFARPVMLRWIVVALLAPAIFGARLVIT